MHRLGKVGVMYFFYWNMKYLCVVAATPPPDGDIQKAKTRRSSAVSCCETSNNPTIMMFVWLLCMPCSVWCVCEDMLYEQEQEKASERFFCWWNSDFRWDDPVHTEIILLSHDVSCSALTSSCLLSLWLKTRKGNPFIHPFTLLRYSANCIWCIRMLYYFTLYRFSVIHVLQFVNKIDSWSFYVLIVFSSSSTVQHHDREQKSGSSTGTV